MRCALNSLEGKVNLRRLKDQLCPDVIIKTGWAKWWTDVRTKMVARGVLRVGAGNNPMLELLNIPTTREDEYADMLAACHTPVEFAQTMLKYIGEETTIDDRAPFISKQMQLLFDLISSKDMIPDGEKILGKYLLDDVKDFDGDVDLDYPLDVAEIASDNARALKALEALRIADYEVRFLKEVENVNSTWAMVFAEAMLRDIPETWDFVAMTLRESGEDRLLHDSCRKIYDHAFKLTRELDVAEDASDEEKAAAAAAGGKAWPVQFMWLSRKVIGEGNGDLYGIDASFPTMMIEILRLGMDIHHRMDRGERRARKHLLLFRNLLAERQCRLLQNTLNECEVDAARHILHSIEVNRALSDARIESMAKIVRDRFPSLAKVEEVVEEEAILCTAAGLRKKRKELSDIQNNELPEVQKAIGEALALGDISENSELDAARTKEDQLKNQMARIVRDLEQVRELTVDEIDASMAGFGTKVKLKNLDSGDIEEFTILGRWDANIEEGIISDISAIGRGVTGLKLNESNSFQTPDGATVNYEVIGLEAASF